MRRRGSALALALGVLGLLCAFAMTLVALTNVERNASAAWLDGRRATLVAEAGVQRAISELAALADEPLAATTESAPWAFRDPGGCFANGVPLEGAKRCSFESGTLALANGNTIPYSGQLGATYALGADVYCLKVIDVTAQLDLNDRRPSLAHMLDTLGRAIQLDRGRDPIHGLGQAIIAFRDAMGGLTSKRQLAAVLGPDDARLLADYVTTDGWADPAARRASAGPRSFGSAALPSFLPERRCPVNVNSAPKPVLVALLEGVNGIIELPNGTKIPGRPVGFDQACTVADRIIARRRSLAPDEGPFRDITDFAEFIGAQSPLLDGNQISFVLGNLDPNLRVNEINPDATARIGAAKYSLLFRTTEATFFPHGRFETTSLGRVLSDGAVIAESCRVVVVEVYSVERHTTQLDFEYAALQATSMNVATFPDPVRRLGPAKASPDGGYVALCDPQTQSSISNPGFTADFTRALDAGADAARGTRIQDDPQTVNGDLGPDGTYTSATKRPLTYGSVADPREGAIEAWVKLEYTPPPASGQVLPGSIVWQMNVLAPNSIITTSLTGYSDGTDLTINMERKLYASNVALFVGSGPSETRARATVPKAGTYGEWHHVRVAWMNYTQAGLFVDGVPAQTVVQIPSASGSWPIPPTIQPPYADGTSIGGHLLNWQYMTADDVVFQDGGVSDLTSGFAPPERYPARDPDDVGKFVGCFGPFEPGAQFGTIYWTERLPAKWGDVTFAQGDFEVEVVSGDPLAPTKLNMPKRWRKRAKVALPPTGQPPRDQWFWPALEPTPPPSLQVFRYEVHFDYLRAGEVPLAVSPILDDVTIVFRARPRFVRVETEDD